MRYIFYYETILGKLGIVTEDKEVAEIFFGKKKVQAEEKETPFIKQIYHQIEEYFIGERTHFTIPFTIKGTDFQRNVYQALLEIPYGETRTYEEVARSVGSPKACRAVGLIASKNPLSILIPCHRVIGKTGNLTGYAGGLTRKKRLLEIEKKNRGD